MSNELYKMYLDYMQIDDLPEWLQPIAEKIGIEDILNVIDEFGGLRVYFPLPEKAVSKARGRVICKEYREQNHSFSELAKRHKVSEPWVRQVVRDGQTQLKATSVVHEVLNSKINHG